MTVVWQRDLVEGDLRSCIAQFRGMSLMDIAMAVAIQQYRIYSENNNGPWNPRFQITYNQKPGERNWDVTIHY